MLYVADTENHLLRKVDLKQRRVVTVAGTGRQAENGWPGLGTAEEISGSPRCPSSFRRPAAADGPEQPVGCVGPSEGCLHCHGRHASDMENAVDANRKSAPSPAMLARTSSMVRLLPAAAVPGTGFRLIYPAERTGNLGWSRSLFVADSEGSSIRQPCRYWRAAIAEVQHCYRNRRSAVRIVCLHSAMSMARAKGLAFNIRWNYLSVTSTVIVADFLQQQDQGDRSGAAQRATIAGTGSAGHDDAA